MPETRQATVAGNPGGSALVLHIPHASRVIPAGVREQFVLSDAELDRELLRMTDAHTDRLFAAAAPGVPAVVFPVSRLVVDPERFLDDAAEPMSQVGMGAVYSRTADGAPLRRRLSGEEREELIATYYQAHHDRLARVTRAMLDQAGHCLIVDCHSFPSKPLRCDLDQAPDRPDICLGTDEAHTPPWVVEVLRAHCLRAGLSVAINRPYAGALVPGAFYRTDHRVGAVLVEVNRRLYMDETTGLPGAGFDQIQAVLARALTMLREASLGRRELTDQGRG